MKRYLLTSLFLLLLTILAPSSAHAETTASDVVKGFYAALVDTMKQGPELGFEGRYKKLEPEVTKAFNLSLMARYAVGPSWAKASPEDQQNLVKEFSNFSVATYASRFSKFDGELFEVKGEKTTANGIMVETHLTPKDSEPVTLNYLVRKDEEGALRIVDVYLDASISELATRRSEFSSVVKREGLAALISSLAEKTKKMGSNQPS